MIILASLVSISVRPLIRKSVLAGLKEKQFGHPLTQASIMICSRRLMLRSSSAAADKRVRTAEYQLHTADDLQRN